MGFAPMGFSDIDASATEAYHFQVEIMEVYVEEPHIPENERWIHDNPEILASIQRGIQQADRCEVFDLGDFSRSADLSDD